MTVKKGTLEVTTVYGSGSKSVREYDVIEHIYDGFNIVTKIPIAGPGTLASTYDAYNVDLTKTVDLDLMFNEMGTNTYMWLTPMTLVPGGAGSGNTVLWSGVMTMNDLQTATLKDKISNQEKGIILAFSAYTDGAASDSDWHYYHVPKQHVKTRNGQGICVNLFNSQLSKIGSKYLYISDDKIVGHANNTKTGTSANGIQFANNAWVLREIIGE